MPQSCCSRSALRFRAAVLRVQCWCDANDTPGRSAQAGGHCADLPPSHRGSGARGRGGLHRRAPPEPSLRVSLISRYTPRGGLRLRMIPCISREAIVPQLTNGVFTPSAPSSLREDAFHRIADTIASGELAPGERLLDVELAERMHMSRMPIREALQRLERVGLVEILPSRMTRVTSVTEASIRMTLQHAGYQAGVVAHMSVPRLTPEERLESMRLIDLMIESLPGEPGKASRARRRVYAYFSERSGNSLHHAHMSDMEVTLERNLGQRAIPAEAVHVMVDLCEQLRQAVLDADGPRAEQIVRRLHGIVDGPAREVPLG